MPQWVRCTNTDDQEVYLNLDTAAMVRWDDSDKQTVITYPTQEGRIRVKETPEDLFAAAAQNISHILEVPNDAD